MKKETTKTSNEACEVDKMFLKEGTMVFSDDRVVQLILYGWWNRGRKWRGIKPWLSLKP